MIKKEKGATLGIVIVLILFLSMIAFLVMSMATIVSFTVIKNDKLADAEIQLKIVAQQYLNQLTQVAYEAYYFEGDYLYYLNDKLNGVISSINYEGHVASYDNQIFTFTIKDKTKTINKTLLVEVKFY